MDLFLQIACREPSPNPRMQRTACTRSTNRPPTLLVESILIRGTIYFASVNYALRFQESATSLIAPSGQCQAYLPYGQEGVLVQAINVEEATGLLATRYAPERYQETRGTSDGRNDSRSLTTRGN